MIIVQELHQPRAGVEPRPSYCSSHTCTQQDSRIRALLLHIGHGQIPAAHHKDVKLSQLLDVVDSKLEAALDIQVTHLCRENAAAAAADLHIYLKKIKIKIISNLGNLSACISSVYIELVLFLLHTFIG